MARLAALVAVLCLLGAAEALRNVVKTREVETPQGWNVVRRANPDSSIRVLFALKHNNQDKVDDLFKRITDPDSREWRNFLTAAQVHDIIRPSQASIDKVTNWLSQSGIAHELTPSHDAVYATMTIAQAEALLDAEPFHVYASEKLGRRAVVTRAHALPADIAEVVAVVGGISRLPSTLTPKRVNSAVDAQYTAATPYGILSQTAGDAQLLLIFRPICSDGSVPSSETNMCSTVSAITNFVVTVAGDGFDSVVKTYPAAVVDGTGDGLLTCHTCSNWIPTGYSSITEGICANQTRWAEIGVVCTVTVRPLENYVPLHVKSFTINYASAPANTSAGLYNVILSPFTTPDLILDLYGVPVGTRGRNAKNSMAVEEFLDQYYAPSDLNDFFQRHGVFSQPQPFVVGPNNITNPGGEATLDIEYIMAVAPNIKTYFWSVGGRHRVNDTENPDQEPFLEWLVALQNNADIPLVHSVSYSDIEATIDQAYRDTCDNIFKTLALRGISVLFASGDDGAVGFQAREQPEKCSRSNPAWPNTSPYVTNVGATQVSLVTKTDAQLSRVVTPINARNPLDTGVGAFLNFYARTPSERVCSSDTGGVITSGGGFSDYAPMPDYQKGAVNAYLSDPTVHLPPENWFSRGNRAYPDVSAIGHKFLCIQSGQIVSVHGTSASTPVFAAIVALLNDRLLEAGQKPLGFLNPLFYKWAVEHPEAFIDVTAGDNRCPVVVKNCCQYGFEAARGWDPTTGLGSPRYDVMLELLLGSSSTGPVVVDVAETSSQKTTKGVAAAGLAFGLLAFILSAVMLVLALKRNRSGYSAL